MTREEKIAAAREAYLAIERPALEAYEAIKRDAVDN